MITMENTRELIDFEYYGKSYRMAPDEIEAAAPSRRPRRASLRS